MSVVIIMPSQQLQLQLVDCVTGLAVGPSVSGRAAAAVTIDSICAGAAVLTRTAGTLVYFCNDRCNVHVQYVSAICIYNVQVHCVCIVQVHSAGARWRALYMCNVHVQCARAM